MRKWVELAEGFRIYFGARFPKYAPASNTIQDRSWFDYGRTTLGVSEDLHQAATAALEEFRGHIKNHCIRLRGEFVSGTDILDRYDHLVGRLRTSKHVDIDPIDCERGDIVLWDRPSGRGQANELLIGRGMSVDRLYRHVRCRVKDLEKMAATVAPKTPEGETDKHQYRYPGDAKLVAEGRALIKEKGITKREAARIVAEKAAKAADNLTVEQKKERDRKIEQHAERLRKLF
jgi:hypothetical protein